MDEQELKNMLYDDREKTRREMREEIDALFRKESETFQTQIRLYLSAARWIGLAVAAILTVFGVTKASDIEKNITDYLKEKVERQYRLDEPDSSFSKTMNKLIARAVAASVFLEATAAQQNRIYPDNINYSRRQETNILLGIVEDPESNFQVFSEAVTGLSYLADSDEPRVFVSQVLAKILVSDEVKKHGWAKNNEEKILSVLGFPKSDIINSAANIMLSNGSDITDKIVETALNRFRREGYSQAAKTVSEIAASTESRDVQFYSVLTLATIRPAHPNLSNLILAGILKEGKKTALRNIQIVEALVDTRHAKTPIGTPVSMASGSSRVKNLAVPIMQAEIESGLSVSYDKNSGMLTFNDRMVSWLRLDKGIYETELIDPLLKYANAISTAKLAFYIESIRPRGDIVNILATLGRDSKVITDQGEEITLDAIKEGEVEILPQEINDIEAHLQTDTYLSGGLKYLQLSWMDVAGRTISRKGRLINPEQFRIWFP